MTQPLQTVPPLNLGGSATPAAPVPAGRSVASLRTPRGTNFVRLAFAAMFLMGFLGLVGYLLKDYLPGVFSSLLGHEMTEEAAKKPAPASKLADSPPAKKPAVAAPPPSESRPALNTPGFDPHEPSIPKAGPASAAALAAAGTVRSSNPAPATNAVPMEATTSAPGAATALREVPARPAVNAVPPGNAAASSPAGSTPQHDIEEEGVQPAAQPAVDALKKFLAAKSLEERLKYTLGAELMKPLMERYYARAPDGPIPVDRIQFVRLDPNPELGSGKHCILSLENKSWEYAVPVMLEEKPDGYKVDWVAFVEFKDRMLEKFFQAYQEGKACFHVGIIRHHYFEDGVPNLDKKDAFRVSPAPPNPFQASVFLDKDSALAQELRTHMPWETHIWAVVELEWKKLGSQQWVELSAVPQMHWYSLPTSSKAIAESPKSAPAEDLPPGISKNGSRSKSGSKQAQEPPPGIRKSSPDLPATIKRPLPAGR